MTTTEQIPSGTETNVTVVDLPMPTDTTPSRLNRTAPKPDAPDDATTAGERIEAFWERHPDGSILTEIEHRESNNADIYTVRVFVRKHGDAEAPDATAHATRSSADPDPVTAAFPQETAETSAVSRALRNLGILATPKKPAPIGTPAPAPAEAPTKKASHVGRNVADARRNAGLTQIELAQEMRRHKFSWTQNLVSRIERNTRPLTEDEATQLADLIGYEDTP